MALMRRLEQLGYMLSGSKLQNIKTGGPFKFVDQEHYEQVGDVLVEIIQELMVEKYGMQRVELPSDDHIKAWNCGQKERVDPSTKCPIFVSKNAATAKDLLILICGSGAVQAGQFARALCINESLDSGSALKFLEWANNRNDNTAVVVLNPNHNSHEEVLIPYNEDSTHHALYVWDAVCKDLPAENIAMVAHSAGGINACELLKHRESELLPRLRCIAFTDSAHGSRVNNLPSAARRFIVQKCTEWVASNEPLGTVVTPAYPSDAFFEAELREESSPMEVDGKSSKDENDRGWLPKNRRIKKLHFNCLEVSAGTASHAATTMNSFSQIIDFINESLV